MKRSILSIFTTLVCLFANTSYAVPIVTSSGVTGLEVNGVLYDIAIGDFGGITAGEAFAELDLSSSQDPTLFSINTALAQALNVFGFADSDFFDGCGGNVRGRCDVVIPTLLSIGVGYVGGVTTFISPTWVAALPTRIDPADRASELNFITYGVVSRSAVVPAPATLALFGLGLAGIGITRRRRPAQV